MIKPNNKVIVGHSSVIRSSTTGHQFIWLLVVNLQLYSLRMV